MIRAPCSCRGSRCQLRLTSANVAADGAKMSPARSGVSPRPPCRCRASAKKNPPNTAMVTNRAATPMVTPGRLSTRPGISGDPPRAATRRSTTANSPNAAALPARQIQPHTGQCSGWPRTSGSTRATAAGVSSARPAGSRPRPRSAAPCGSIRTPVTSRATPIGTLTRNTARQPLPNRLAVTSRPPAIWPATAPPAMTAAYSRIAPARDVPVKVRWMRLSTCGIMAAAPAPWMKRRATSMPVEVARPQPSEATVNRASPARNIRR